MCISSLTERISAEYSAGRSCWALGSLLGQRMSFRGAGGDLSRASRPAPPSILSPESPSPGRASGCSSSTGCIIGVFKGFGPKSSPAQLNVCGSSEVERRWPGERSEQSGSTRTLQEGGEVPNGDVPGNKGAIFHPLRSWSKALAASFSRSPAGLARGTRHFAAAARRQVAKGALAGARLPSHCWARRSCCWLCSGDAPKPFL